MRTEFTLQATALKVMNKYAALAATLSNMTNETYFIVKEGIMYVMIQGNKTFLHFHVDVDDFTSDNEQEVFSVGLEKLVKTTSRVSMNCATALRITLEPGNAKLTISSAQSQSKVALPCFDGFTPRDVLDASESIPRAIKESFSDGYVTVNVNKGLRSFMKTANKFMGLTKKNNSIMVAKNTAKYADTFSVISFSSEEDFCESSEPVFLHNLIFDVIDAISSGNDALKITVSKDKQYLYFVIPEVGGLQIILQMPPVQLDYPTAEDEVTISPKVDSKTRLTFKKDTFLDGLGMFKDIFDAASWKWRPINFAVNFERAKTDGTITLNYSDFNAEVQKEVSTNSFQTSEIGKDYWEFLFSSELYAPLLALIPTEDFFLEFSSLPADEENGVGVVLGSTDGSITAICTKITR